MFVEILKLMLGQDSEDEIRSRFVFELVNELNPRVRCTFGNVLFLLWSISFQLPTSEGKIALAVIILEQVDWINWLLCNAT